MYKIIILILTLAILYSCSKADVLQTPDLAPRGGTNTASIDNLELKDAQKNEQNFWSGIILISDIQGSILYDKDKVIKNWDQNVKIRVESFDARFYKIYRDLDNDFQIWVYDTLSGNVHEFGNGNMGDIIEKIRVTENAININTKYSTSKIHLNENPYNFPLDKIVWMYLTFSPDFSKLLSWQYQDYYRKISLEPDKEIIIDFLKKKGKSAFTIEKFQLNWTYFKNAAYVGWINSGCFQDWNDQICMVPRFLGIIDNNWEVVYFEETNGDYECKDIEKSLSGKVLDAVWEKYCPQFPKLIYDSIDDITSPQGEKIAKILQRYIWEWPKIQTIERSLSYSGFTIFSGTSASYCKEDQKKCPDSNFFSIFDQEYSQIYYEGITSKEYFEWSGIEFACENINTQTWIINFLREKYCQ